MKKRFIFAFLLMGFTSLAAETLLIREFFVSFNGNELTIGIILANWIMLVALGSLLGGRLAAKISRPVLAYSILQLLIAAYLPICIFTIRVLKNMLGLAVGEGAGISAVFLSSLLIPACAGIFTGMQFPFGCRMAHEASGRAEEAAGTVYAVESAGFMIGGPVITYYLITFLNSFAAVSVVGIANAVSAASLLKHETRPGGRGSSPLWIGAACCASLAIFSLSGPASALHDLSLAGQWKGRELVAYRNSVYGNLALTRNAGQYTFYGNGIPIITTPLPDIASTEALAHFGMLSHASPKDVLIIGGGAGGMIHEILKYPVEKLSYVELDPSLIRLVNDFPTPLTAGELDEARLDIRYTDGRYFIKITKEDYDVIMVNLPAPSTLAMNRFYTTEFFKEAGRVLGTNGIIVFSLPGSLSYLGPELRDLNASVLAALEGQYSVNVIPGYSNIFIASKGGITLTPDILFQRLEERKISTKTFNKAYLADRLDRQWQEWFYGSVGKAKPLIKNSDRSPAAAYYAAAYLNTMASPRFRAAEDHLGKITLHNSLFAVLICGLIVVALGRYGRHRKAVASGAAIFTAGFVGMSLNLILIYAYQSSYGFLFSHIAMLMASFMAGLAFGGWLMTRSLSRIKRDMDCLAATELSAAAFVLVAGLFMAGPGTAKTPILFFVLLAASGFFVGAEFPLANRIALRGRGAADTAGMLYALDLAGSWLAALLVSAALVPLVGIPGVCSILVCVKIPSIIAVSMNRG
ncbi:MAG: hypothetical protein WC515_08465 [Candidatus Omnitrophota bacterium]